MPPMPPMAPMAPMAPTPSMPVMPPMPPMPAMAPMAPMGPMALFTPMPPLPAELSEFGYLAFQQNAPKAVRAYANSEVTPAKSKARPAHDTHNRYSPSATSYLHPKQ